jgi:phenylpropionate dioxygenase-like ring-hydroxylating dioxygenase large terminal subunit
MDPTELATAIKPLNEATSMPAGFYTDPAVFAAEREHILLKRWVFLAREDQPPAHGDYRCFDTVGGSVILLRDGAMLRAFANICRHRGSQLLDGSGRIDRIVCPYHAWSYRVSGDLLGCPDMGAAG